MAVTSQLYSTLKFTFWPLRSSGQSSEVDSTGIMINPILQMRKVRLGGVNTGLCFSVGSAELGWDSCLAQCCFTANFLVQTKMCRDSGSTLWSRVSVCLEQTRSRTVNGHLNAMPRNGASVEMETLLGHSSMCLHPQQKVPLYFVLSCFKIPVASERTPITFHQLEPYFQESCSGACKNITRLTILFLTEMKMNSVHGSLPSVDSSLAKNHIVHYLLCCFPTIVRMITLAV